MVVPLLLGTLGALVVSVCVTAAALGYARRRGMLDFPGSRRSHTTPTPRGGGAGVVAAALLVGLPAWWWLDPLLPWARSAAVAVALIAVAAVGWRDDLVPMSPLPRMTVHVIAAFLVVLVPMATDPWPWPWWVLPALVVLLVGSVNAHNFMDGIDGLLGQQGLFVLLGYAVLALAGRQSGLAGLAFAGAAGCLGFLFYNAPPARVFMGDVGSGALGLLIGVVAIWLVRGDASMLWACLILPSAFLVDSGLTLLRRILGGQRWYAPHRQHLYQWLVRVKWSHMHVDLAYLAWNLVIVAPLAALAVRWPGIGAGLCVAAYAAEAVVWQTGKRACLARARRGGLRESA